MAEKDKNNTSPTPDETEGKKSSPADDLELANEKLKNAEDEAKDQIQEAEDNVEKFKDEVKSAEAKLRKELLDKYGYEIKSHLFYNKKPLEPGQRNKLSKLKSHQIKRLVESGTIAE